MTIRPVSSAPAAAPLSRPVEQLAQDVVERGATLEVPRRFRLWGPRLRPAEPHEVAERLQKGKHDAQVRLGETSLPLRTPEDLQELQVFLGGAPPETLPRPDLAHSLQDLAGQGWRFHTPEQGEIGLYGAYNALTDPGFELTGLEARRNDLPAPISSPTRLAELEQFYRQDPLAGLEQKGYQFFDGQGKPRLAFGETPPAGLGRDGQVWLEASRSAELPRLEGHLARLGRLELAQRALQYQDRPDLKALWEGLEPAQRAALAPVALEAQPDLLVSARQHIRPQDDELQTIWLKELAGRPETEAMARLALEVRRDPKAHLAAWQTMLDCPAPNTGGELLEALGTLSPAYLEALQKFPDTKDVAARLAAWQPTNQAHALEGLKSCWRDRKPDELALRCTAPDDREMQLRQLGPLARDLVAGVPGLPASYALWKSCRQDPATFTELLEQVRSFDRCVQTEGLAVTQEDITAARQGMLRVAERLPDSKPTFETLRRWGLTPGQTVLDALIKGETEPRHLARLCTTAQDQQAQDRQLAELVPGKTGALAGELRQACSSEACRTAFWKVALERQPVDSAAGLVEFVRAFDRELGQQDFSGREADIQAVKGVLYRRLADFPEARPAWDAQQRWGLSDPDQAWMAMLKVPSAATPAELGELALASTAPTDLAAQDRQLAELCPDGVAGRMRAACQAPEARLAVWKAAMKRPGVASGKAALELVREFDRQNTQSYALHDQDIRTLQSLLVQEFDRWPDTQAARSMQTAWGLQDDARALAGMLSGPDLGTPAGIGAFALASTAAGDTQAQERQLDQLGARLAREMRDASRGEPTRLALWKAAMKHPVVSTAAEMVALVKTFDRELGTSQTYPEREADISALRVLLYQHMADFSDSRPAYEAQQRWGLADREMALNALLAVPPAGTREQLCKLAEASTGEGDLAAQKRELEELADKSAAAVLREMMDLSQGTKTRVGLWKAGMQRPGPVQSSDDLLELVRKFDELVGTRDNYPEREQDIGRLQRAIWEGFKRLPDSQAAVSRVEAWQPANWDAAYAGLLKNRKAGNPDEVRALALDCTHWTDQATQDRQLTELGQDPALKDVADLALQVRQRTPSPEVRWALWHAVLENPYLNTSTDVQAAATRMRELLANQPAKQAEIDQVAALMETTVQVWMLRGKGNQTVAVEDDRVVVGGVVLRRPARSAPGAEAESSGLAGQ